MSGAHEPSGQGQPCLSYKGRDGSPERCIHVLCVTQLSRTRCLQQPRVCVSFQPRGPNGSMVKAWLPRLRDEDLGPPAA